MGELPQETGGTVAIIIGASCEIRCPYECVNSNRNNLRRFDGIGTEFHNLVKIPLEMAMSSLWF